MFLKPGGDKNRKLCNPKCPPKDIRGLFLNIDGIICFRSVVSFGGLGLVFHYLLEPMGGKLFRRIPKHIIYAGCIILIAVFLADCILSFLFRTPITY